MVRFRSLVLVPALLMVLSLAAACGDEAEDSQPTPVGATYPQSVRQSDGQTLTVGVQPQRIVSLAAHATEIFCALGAGSQLVAVDKYANCPLGTSAKPELDGFSPNLEAIAGYRPDLVYVSSNTGGVVEGLRRLNIAVLYLELPETLEGVLSHIEQLAKVAGRQAEARKLVSDMRVKMDGVKSKISSVSQGPRVFHELTDDYYSVGPGSFVGDFYTFLKAQNIAAGASSDYPQLSAEVIVQRNPDVIVLADEDAGVTPESVKTRPGWAAIAAVRNNRICLVDPDVVSRPGPRIVEALDVLAKCIYPETFR
jgi:iron complex transport system substrate-binding protein